MCIFCRHDLVCNISVSDYADRLTEYRAQLVQVFVFQNTGNNAHVKY